MNPACQRCPLPLIRASTRFWVHDNQRIFLHDLALQNLVSNI
jgi:hypothetical protein